MNMETIRFIYEDMVAAYWDSLNTVLRGFNAQGEFLDLWVPDEDGVISILNLVEAVQEKGHDALELTVGAETTSAMDMARLNEELVSLGQVEIQEQGAGILLRVSGLAEGAAFHNVHPIYVSGLRAALKGQSYQGTLASPDASAAAEGLSLAVTLDAAKRLLITQARWQGNARPLEAALLNATCKVLEGITLTDASDHGLLRLEDALRDEKLHRPTGGIIIPERVESSFGLPLQLLRGLMVDYHKKDPEAGKVNFFVPAFSTGWQAASEAQRKERVAQAARDFLKDRKFDDTTLTIESVDAEGRVMVSVRESINVHLKGELILKLERYLDKNLEPNLHLYMEELEDHNAKRRQGLHKDELHNEEA